jgi:hypothetical protein
MQNKKNIIWLKFPGIILLLGFIISPLPGISQHYVKLSFENLQKSDSAVIDSLYLIKTNFPATGIVTSIDMTEKYTGAFLIVQNDTSYLTADEDIDQMETSLFCNLLTFSIPVEEFMFYPGEIKGPVVFYFINSLPPDNSSTTPETKKKRDDCSEPEMIGQEVWRDGLAEPDYERIPNEVHNIIVHHSAGSNSDTAYISVVRAIYIYHTEVRGWSDIGYNYLIAQDGTIFKGRDPGPLLEQDEVLGAHFCNSNTGTLGICVLGDYTSIDPPGEAIESLNNLLTWELGKDSLDPLGTYPHPLNQNLPVIAGHRDGCATECPGEKLYQQLGDIRQEASASFENCGYSIKPLTNELFEIRNIILMNSGEGTSLYFGTETPPEIFVFDLLGKSIPISIRTRSSHEIEIVTNNLKPGTYIITVRWINFIKSFNLAVF